MREACVKRAEMLVKAVGTLPLIFLDIYSKDPPYGNDIEKLPSNIPLIQLPFYTDYQRQSICFLCDYLPPEFAERIRKKFGC